VVTLQDAAEIFRNEGVNNLIGKSLRVAGNKILSEEAKKRHIVENYSEETKYLNVGGDTFLKSDWRVLDYYTDWYDYHPVFVDYDVDLETCNRWPINANEFDLVYSSHTLEHLTDRAIKHTLEEINRVLKPGGTVRVNVPDVELALEHYESENLNWFEDVWLENYSDDVFFAADKCPGYEREFYLLSFFATYLARARHTETDFSSVRTDYEKMEQHEFLSEYASRVRNEWHSKHPGWHRNWFDADRLCKLFEATGFESVHETDCRKSRHTEFNTTHFDKRPHMSVFVEATNP
jgi:predicted SAM-dependent methyltransferase